MQCFKIQVFCTLIFDAMVSSAGMLNVSVVWEHHVEPNVPSGD